MTSPIIVTSPAGTDKKRGRPLEEPPRSRKKIATELMAFEFQSLSLSNCEEALLLDTLGRSESELRPHPPVQQQSLQVHLEQEHDPHSITSAQPQQEQQPAALLIDQSQRSRAKSSPAVSPFIVAQEFTETSQGEAADPHHGPSSTTPPPTTPLKYDLNYSTHLHPHQARMDSGAEPPTSSSSSSSSSVSTPLPSMGSDMTMMMMDEATETDKPPEAMSIQEVAVERNATPTSSIKVLNMRQRKWNSATKSWQEWEDVQATHTPNDLLPFVHTQQTQFPNGNSDPGLNGAGPGSIIAHGVPNHWQETHGKSISSEGEPMVHSQSSGGFGYQRRESQGKSKLKLSDELLGHDQRSVFGARARSFSETNINPYTQHHHQNQHQQDDPYVLTGSHSQSGSSSTPYQASSSRRATITATQVEFSHHGYYRQASMHHSGHQGRQTSSHIGSHHVEHWELVGNGNANESVDPQPSWMGLSKTALSDTMNVPSDQYSGPVPNPPGSTFPPLSPTIQLIPFPPSTESPHDYRHEEQGTWSQQLLKSQNAYHEVYEAQRQGYDPNSPLQYTHQHQYQQHGGLEDVSMDDDSLRPIPSRSSSPAPCLSMIPPITRPLSISFSQLTGPNMLGNLSEHEQDDDMEL
ncbi:hypothetical protein B0O80DRAFT_498738 [Mortierella sp. GBAus27b]|nr:hypothetical protein B0O80DRAFT_498738 [Mortierella sp. GBAus27b]